MDFEGIFFDPNDFSLTNIKLGEGSFGTVYLATNIQNGITYAAKLINTDIEIDGNDQKKIMRESIILSKLNHGSILKFIGVNFRSLINLSDFQPTIITEYLPNGSLKVILDKEKNSIADYKWTPTKKYICLIGISDAMRYLHEQDILHRDLKPENILIDEEYYPRICDFGLSKCFPESFSKSMKLALTCEIGTPLYMSPELIMGEKYGQGVDVYAFSIIAYEIITGKEPYYEFTKKLNQVQLFQKVVNGIRPSFTKDIPKKMQQLISRCWDKDINARPSFKEIFDILSSDFSLSPEDVDENEINEYLEYIKDIQDTSKESKKTEINEEQNILINNCLEIYKDQMMEQKNINDLFHFVVQLGNAKAVEYLLSYKSIDINMIKISFAFLFNF